MVLSSVRSGSSRLRPVHQHLDAIEDQVQPEKELLLLFEARRITPDVLGPGQPLSWLAAGVGLLAGTAEAATSFTGELIFIPLRQHCVGSRPLHSGGAGRLRPVPAVHPHHRDHAWAVDGTHVDRCRGRARSVAGHRLLRRHHRRLGRCRLMAVRAPDRSLSPRQWRLTFVSRNPGR